MIPREKRCGLANGSFMNLEPLEDEEEDTEQRIKIFKFWFFGIVAVCATVIIGAAIFYSLIDY